MTDTTSNDDLADLFETGLGLGPTPTSPQVPLQAGRRARGRRRIAAGGASLALVAVAGTLALSLGGGDAERRTEPPLATDVPTSTPSEPTTSATSDSPIEPVAVLRRGEDVQLLSDGTLMLRSGVTVLQQVDNPYGTVLPDRSVGVDYRKDGKEIWALLTYLDSTDVGQGSYRTSDPAGTAYDTFEEWLAAFNAINGDVADESGGPLYDYVRFADDGTLEAQPGVTVLEQTPDVGLWPGFGGPGADTAAAEVRVKGEGTYYVLARHLAGYPAEYFVPVPTRYNPDTLGGFIEGVKESGARFDYPIGDEFDGGNR